MDKLLLTVDEAAERLGLRRAKTYQLILSGELPSIKLGKSRRVPMRLLEAYVEGLIREQIPEFGLKLPETDPEAVARLQRVSNRYG